MKQTVLITGASSGIGLELAKQFAADRYDVILAARRLDLLEKLALELTQTYRVQAIALECDLALPDAPRKLVESLQQQGITVDVLVNNAGFGEAGAFAQLDGQIQTDMVQVNVAALTQLARLLLPGMLMRGYGGILNVGSVAGFVPGPYMAVYYATKAYVVSFSQALAEEVAGSGVRVTCLAPGATRTDFFSREGLAASRLSRGGMASAEYVAKDGYEAFKKGRVLAVSGIGNKLLVIAIRFSPHWLSRKVTLLLNR